MVEIKMDKLIEVCRIVYDGGVSGSADLRDSFINDVLQKNGISSDDQWRVYTVKELQQMPIGTLFSHSLLGRGTVCERAESKVKYIVFAEVGPRDLNVDLDPWDKPMKLLSLAENT